MEDNGGIENKVERLHKGMDGVENGNLDTTPKDMFVTIHAITDEAAGPRGERNEASLQTLERILGRARGQADNGEVAKEIEQVEELVSDQFDTLLHLRQQINPLV